MHIGASLVFISDFITGAAAAYLKEGFSNIRVGMFLEVATTIGAICGAYLATRIPTAAIAIIFGVVLLYSALLDLRRKIRTKSDPRPAGTYSRASAEELDGSLSHAGRQWWRIT